MKLLLVRFSVLTALIVPSANGAIPKSAAIMKFAKSRTAEDARPISIDEYIERIFHNIGSDVTIDAISGAFLLEGHLLINWGQIINTNMKIIESDGQQRFDAFMETLIWTDRQGRIYDLRRAMVLFRSNSPTSQHISDFAGPSQLRSLKVPCASILVNPKHEN